MYAVFSYTFTTIMVTSFIIELVSAEYYAFMNPLNYRFRSYMKAYMVASHANSGNATNLLSMQWYIPKLGYIAIILVVCLTTLAWYLGVHTS